MSSTKDTPGQAARSWATVNEQYRRQVPQRWGADLEPAIRAVTGEAPPGSTPLAFKSFRLRRTMHGLSKPEGFFIALALYNPWVWDVHEQHLLHPYPCQHPLAAHPIHRHQPWPSTSGTLQILNEWGLLSRHPYVTNPAFAKPTEGSPSVASGSPKLPRPWIGDVLLFLSDSIGPYAVEWDVKDVTGAHAKPWAGDWKVANSKRRISGEELRDRAYQRYLEELGIPIRRVALDQINSKVVDNLIWLALRNQEPLTVPRSQAIEVECALQEAVRTGETPGQSVRRVVKGDQAVLASLRVIDNAIWERRLRVDLTKDILHDRPLMPEVADLLTVHADLFAR